MTEIKKEKRIKNEEYYENGQFKMKNYYQHNREKILEKNKKKNVEIVECECGASIQYVQQARHRRTKKHQNALKKINQKINEVAGEIYRKSI